jgi:hypothetical protein
MESGEFRDKDLRLIKRGFYCEGYPVFTNIYFITGEIEEAHNWLKRRKEQGVVAKSYAFYLTGDIGTYFLISKGEIRSLRPVSKYELEEISKNIHPDDNPPQPYRKRGKVSFEKWLQLVQEF